MVIHSLQNRRLTLPSLSFRAKRGIFRSITERLNDEILRFAQDDNA